MLKKILFVVVAVLAVLAIVVATRPDRYEVSRSVTLAAPAVVAYEQVADFHRWSGWSPWAKLDPGMKEEHGGPVAGTGATYHWLGNDKVGEGRMTITDAQPGARVAVKLEFLKPFESLADTTFSFAPEAGGTKVTWSMAGKLGFVEKAMCLVKSMDAMIGPDFEKGLAALKGVAEAEARKATQAQVVPAAAAAVPAK